MPARIERFLATLMAALIGWLAVLALAMRVSDAAPAALVPVPSQAFLDALPAEAAILDIGPRAVTFANRPGLTGDLYKAGAHLVLPAGRKGCVWFRNATPPD